MAILTYPVTIVIDLTPVKEGKHGVRYRITEHIEKELVEWLPCGSGKTHHVRTTIDLAAWKATCTIHVGERPAGIANDT